MRAFRNKHERRNDTKARAQSDERESCSCARNCGKDRERPLVRRPRGTGGTKRFVMERCRDSPGAQDKRAKPALPIVIAVDWPCMNRRTGEGTGEYRDDRVGKFHPTSLKHAPTASFRDTAKPAPHSSTVRAPATRYARPCRAGDSSARIFPSPSRKSTSITARIPIV